MAKVHPDRAHYHGQNHPHMYNFEFMFFRRYPAVPLICEVRFAGGLTKAYDFYFRLDGIDYVIEIDEDKHFADEAQMARDLRWTMSCPHNILRLYFSDDYARWIEIFMRYGAMTDVGERICMFSNKKYEPLIRKMSADSRLIRVKDEDEPFEDTGRSYGEVSQLVDGKNIKRYIRLCNGELLTERPKATHSSSSTAAAALSTSRSAPSSSS